jgi:hypothetical protein
MMAEQATTMPKSKCRWLQFSLVNRTEPRLAVKLLKASRG